MRANILQKLIDSIGPPLENRGSEDPSVTSASNLSVEMSSSSQGTITHQFQNSLAKSQGHSQNQEQAQAQNQKNAGTVEVSAGITGVSDDPLNGQKGSNPETLKAETLETKRSNTAPTS